MFLNFEKSRAAITCNEN